MEQQTSGSERSDRISRLLKSHKSRASYIKAKLAVLVPAQIKALRLKSTDPPMPKQSDLGRESGMQQSRISMFETPGAANITLETLSKIAAGLRCGLIVEFVPFSDMLRWENSFSPEQFDVTRLQNDREFIEPDAVAMGQYPIENLPQPAIGARTEVGIGIAPPATPIFPQLVNRSEMSVVRRSLRRQRTRKGERREYGRRKPRSIAAGTNTKSAA